MLLFIFYALFQAVFCIRIVVWSVLPIAALIVTTGLIAASRLVTSTLIVASAGLITAALVATLLAWLIAALLPRLVSTLLAGLIVALLARLIAALTGLITALLAWLIASLLAWLVAFLAWLIAAFGIVIVVAGAISGALTGLIASAGLVTIALLIATSVVKTGTVRALLTCPATLESGSKALGTEPAFVIIVATIGAVSTLRMDAGALRTTLITIISLIIAGWLVAFTAAFILLSG